MAMLAIAAEIRFLKRSHILDEFVLSSEVSDTMLIHTLAWLGSSLCSSGRGSRSDRLARRLEGAEFGASCRFRRKDFPTRLCNIGLVLHLRPADRFRGPGGKWRLQKSLLRHESTQFSGSRIQDR